MSAASAWRAQTFTVVRIDAESASMVLAAITTPMKRLPTVVDCARENLITDFQAAIGMRVEFVLTVLLRIVTGAF
jgi:hypothetical protein